MGNDAYRYVDWVLTVPLLLIELILVMGLPAEETVSKSWKLGVASAAMVALGYPGEIQDSASGRWMWWFFAMLPFLYVVAELAVGLVPDTQGGQAGQEEEEDWPCQAPHSVQPPLRQRGGRCRQEAWPQLQQLSPASEPTIPCRSS